jgi:hypothetical protein
MQLDKEPIKHLTTEENVVKLDKKRKLYPTECSYIRSRYAISVPKMAVASFDTIRIHLV